MLKNKYRACAVLGGSNGDYVTTDPLYLFSELVKGFGVPTILDLVEDSYEIETFLVDPLGFVDIHAITHVLLGLFEAFVDLD